MAGKIIRKGFGWKKSRIDDVPRGSGVYILQRGGKRLYVGQSSNLKQRLKQHEATRDVNFTSLSWYRTNPPRARFNLEKTLQRKIKKR